MVRDFPAITTVGGYRGPGRGRRSNYRYAITAAKYGVPAVASYAYQKWMGPSESTAATNTVGGPANTKRVKGRKVKSFPKKVKSQIRELKRISESDMGTHIHRIRLAGFAGNAAQNNVSYANFDSINITNIELALAQLRYYNPEIPGTLTQAAGATGTFQKEFYIKRIYSKMTFRNNYQIPADLSVYACRVRADTSQAPDSAVIAGLIDVGNPTATSPLVYPSDSILFKDLWKIEASKKVVVEPGEQVTLAVSSSGFQYDPALSDTHNLGFQTRFKGLSFLVRVTGVFGHDTVEAEFALLPAKLDCYLDTTIEVHYAAGADIKFITIADNSDASFTNGGVVSNKPVADNQAFSVV